MFFEMAENVVCYVTKTTEAAWRAPKQHSKWLAMTLLDQHLKKKKTFVTFFSCFSGGAKTGYWNPAKADDESVLKNRERTRFQHREK